MKKRVKRWAMEDRLRLFRELQSKFGPYETWGKSYPEGFQTEYERFLQVFADRHGCSVDAVRLQIRWAVPDQDAVVDCQISSWVPCKAAAREAGFIAAITTLPRPIKRASASVSTT